jgi:hypothetical protein
MSTTTDRTNIVYDNINQCWWVEVQPGWHIADDRHNHTASCKTKREAVRVAAAVVPCDCADCRKWTHPRS